MGDRRILMGVVGRPHGVRGLTRVHSYTADPADLARYYPLRDESGRAFALDWVGPGLAQLYTLDGGLRRKVGDRTAAERLTNTRLFVARDQLPAPGDDTFYLADLVGLAAVDPGGAVLGRVDAVHDYGGGASLEIGRHVVPFTRACVPEIDLATGRVTVALPVETFIAAPPIPARPVSAALGREGEGGRADQAKAPRRPNAVPGGESGQEGAAP